MTQDRLDPSRIARATWRGLLLGFAFLGELLRRLPGARFVERFSSLIAALLLIAAVVSLAVSMAQRSPQRVSMAQLAAGALSSMQTWIIVSGEVRAESTAAAGYHYVLVDPATPNALLRISSQFELPVGESTVSGTLTGGGRPARDDFVWLGQLRADPVLAREQDPPWVAIALATCGVLVGLLSRTSYPVFFNDQPRLIAVPRRRLDVGVRQDWPPTGEGTPGTLELDPREPVRLRLPGGETRDLRVHSTKSSVEVGRLYWVSGSEPALVVRAARGDLTISFASADDRDGAYAALVASAGMPRRPTWEH